MKRKEIRCDTRCLPTCAARLNHVTMVSHVHACTLCFRRSSWRIAREANPSFQSHRAGRRCPSIQLWQDTPGYCYYGSCLKGSSINWNGTRKNTNVVHELVLLRAMVISWWCRILFIVNRRVNVSFILESNWNQNGTLQFTWYNLHPASVTSYGAGIAHGWC